jgi:hypothetical protein
MAVAAPVERKVTVSTGAAATSGLVLWIIGRYLFKGDVPDVVASWTYVIVPGVLTFAAGWAARHTARPAAPLPALPSNVTVTPPPEKTLIQPPAPE